MLSEYEWRSEDGLVTAESPFLIEFAPDYLHKANISGGSPYGLAVPNAGVDGLVIGDIHQTTFNNYLRVAFEWAGFPGWVRRPYGESQRPPFPGVLRELAAELTRI
jgi:hypothetical protein